MFGCGVYSLVGQILLDFWPKLKENSIYVILRRDIMLELTKIGHDYRKSNCFRFDLILKFRLVTFWVSIINNALCLFTKYNDLSKYDNLNFLGPNSKPPKKKTPYPNWCYNTKMKRDGTSQTTKFLLFEMSCVHQISVTWTPEAIKT